MRIRPGLRPGADDIRDAFAERTLERAPRPGAIAAMLPRGKLTVLPGIGHMLHHVAAERVIEAIDEIASGWFPR